MEQVSEGQPRTTELLVDLVWAPFVGVSTRNSGLSADWVKTRRVLCG